MSAWTSWTWNHKIPGVRGYPVRIARALWRHIRKSRTRLHHKSVSRARVHHMTVSRARVHHKTVSSTRGASQDSVKYTRGITWQCQVHEGQHKTMSSTRGAARDSVMCTRASYVRMSIFLVLVKSFSGFDEFNKNALYLSRHTQFYSKKNSLTHIKMALWKALIFNAICHDIALIISVSVSLFLYPGH